MSVQDFEEKMRIDEHLARVRNKTYLLSDKTPCLAEMPVLKIRDGSLKRSGTVCDEVLDK